MMKPGKTVFLLLTALLITACSSAHSSVTPAAPAQATTTQTRILPTPASPGDLIIWRNLQVAMVQSEITGDFVNEYGVTRNPPAGDRFLWVHVQLKNLGQAEMDTPPFEHYSILYAAAEIKPTYGHRKEHTEYSTLDPVLSPDQVMDGWLRFDIPAAAELKDLRFVFLPESSHVGTSYLSPQYPYSNDKQTFVWKCAP